MGTKGQIQKLEVGQNKLSHLPIDESTLPLKKSSASDVCFNTSYVNLVKAVIQQNSLYEFIPLLFSFLVIKSLP